MKKIKKFLKVVLVLLCLPSNGFTQMESVEKHDPNFILKIKQVDDKTEEDKEGISEIYYENGNLKVQANYRYGKLNGSFISYYKNGVVESEGYYKNHQRKGFWKFYYENGQIKEKGNYRYGELRGHFQSYYKNGKLKSEGNFIDIAEQTGLWKYYDENGEIKEEHIYQNQVMISKTCFDEKEKNQIEVNEQILSKYNPLLRPMVWYGK
tara:strand:- start:182 stop:805 length:624 start_codon:yes stop_codon:yes gene_type:complete